MRVICRKIINEISGEDLGSSSPWFIKDKEYVVLACAYLEKKGFFLYVQSEQYNQPIFTSIAGFEFINQKLSSSWITVFSVNYGRKSMNILPASWNYESFYDDVADEDPKAVSLFNQEAEKIYREENML